MAILTIRTAGLGFGPTPMGAPQPRASDLRQTPSSGGGMSKGMSIPRTITPPGFAPRTFTPKRTTSTFGPPILDTPAAPLPSKSAVATADDFVAETTEANVGQASDDAQDVIKTEEGGTSTNDVVREPACLPQQYLDASGNCVTYRDMEGPPAARPATAPAGMSTGKKIALGVGVGLAALALFSIFK